MKGFVKFLILAIAGFGLGAGAAWLQAPHKSGAPQMQVSKASDEKAPAAKTPEAKASATSAASASTDDGVTTASPAASATDASTKASAELTAADEATDDKAAPLAATNTTTPTTAAETPAAPASETPAAEQVSPEVAQNLAAAKGDAPTAQAGVGGAFSLTDQNGNKVTDKSWPDKYLLVFFGFTNCPDVCPVTLDKLTSALDQLGGDAQKVQPLFITIDAGRDKPAVLKDYLSHFNKSILGLTGTDDQIKAAEDAYKVYASRHDSANGHDYSFDHSAFVYFMTPDGKLAEVIKTEEKAGEIADAMRPWLEGKKQAPDATP